MAEIEIIPDKPIKEDFLITVGEIPIPGKVAIEEKSNVLSEFVLYEKRPIIDIKSFTGQIAATALSPVYQGGDEALIKFIQDNLVYPKKAKKQKIGGEVWVGFVVEKDGSLTNLTINKSVHHLLDKEALRIVKLMPKWIPQQRDWGDPISAQCQIPITFTLDD
jgi:TonB family protein